MPYWQLYYHLVWATKNRQPLLKPSFENEIHTLIRGKAIGLGATVYALNGEADHVHLVAAIPPSLALATFIGRVKGSSSARFNARIGPPNHLYWQNDYSAFSFEGRRLPQYIDYVRRQKDHHVNGTTIAILERTDGETVQYVKEEPISYEVDDVRWRQELLAWERHLAAELEP